MRAQQTQTTPPPAATTSGTPAPSSPQAVATKPCAPGDANAINLFSAEDLPPGGIQLQFGSQDSTGIVNPTFFAGDDLPGTVQVSKKGVITGSFGPNVSGPQDYTVNIRDDLKQMNYVAYFCVNVEDSYTVTLGPGSNPVNILVGAKAKVAVQLPAGATLSSMKPEDLSAWGFTQSSAGMPLTLQASAAQASTAAKSFTETIVYTAADKSSQTANLTVNIVDSLQLTLENFAYVAPSPKNKAHKPYDDLCQYRFNDCDWIYTLTGGAEESELSAQDSQTNPFVSLFVRGPWNWRIGSVWLQVRFLGAANANNTNNVVAAYTSATGSSSSSGLPQVGTALDYEFGYEYDWFHPHKDNPTTGQFTVGAIVAFGATTPLSAQHATTAFVVPAWGTNECNELLSRFPASGGFSGLPAQNTQGTYGAYIGTTVTPTGGTAGSPTYTGPYCIIDNAPIITTASTGTTVVSGTAQTDIAFAPEDRNSFLVKYLAGLRLITRSNSPGTEYCGTSSAPNVGVCSRAIVDFTVGQDEAITGGMLRHWVGKADATFPIPKLTNVYFFGSAAMRFTRNQSFSPLLLQPATIVAAGTTATPPTTITVPSNSTWVLPLTQPNRDFYRIGIGLDLSGMLSKVFTPAKTGQ